MSGCTTSGIPSRPSRRRQAFTSCRYQSGWGTAASLWRCMCTATTSPRMVTPLGLREVIVRGIVRRSTWPPTAPLQSLFFGTDQGHSSVIVRVPGLCTLNWTMGHARGAATEMADDTSSSSFLGRHPLWWFLIGPAGAVGSVWGKRLGEDRPLLGHIVFILGLVLIAIGHGCAIDWAYVRLAGHRRGRGCGL